MLGTLLMGLLLSQGGQGAPVLIPTERLDVGPIVLDVPLGWRRTWKFGTSRFDAPEGMAYFLVDTSTTLTPNLDPSICRDKIILNLGGKSRWRSIAVGGMPAAEQIIVEHSPSGNSTVITARYVGCDGNVTWSITFQGDYSRTRGYFEAMVQQVVDSITYGEKPGPTK
jgi:hypothetical protein